MSPDFAQTLIVVLAFGLSLFNFWFVFLKRGMPQFVCSQWTAIRMQDEKGLPIAAFMIKIGIINRGGVPLEVKDFMLVAKNQSQRVSFYEPLLLWDLRQWIEDGDRPDKVGRTQKGQVPLPVIVPANQAFEFVYPILFLPVDTVEIIKPGFDSQVELALYGLTDRDGTYQRVALQQFTGQEIDGLIKGSFSAIRTSSAVKTRPSFMDRIRRA